MIQHLVNMWLCGIELGCIFAAFASITHKGNKGIQKLGIVPLFLLITFWPIVFTIVFFKELRNDRKK